MSNKELREVTIEDLISNADELQGQRVLLNGFLGKKPYVANNSVVPENIPIYDANGRVIEFQHCGLINNRIDKLNIDLSANHMQEVHAEVYICDRCGEYKINQLKVHTHSRHNIPDEHRTYVFKN